MRIVSEKWEKAPNPYVMVQNELAFIGQVILRGTTIFILNCLGSKLLNLRIMVTTGVVEMKENLGSYAWWMGVLRMQINSVDSVTGVNLLRRRP